MFSYSKRCSSFCDCWAEATLHRRRPWSSACGCCRLWGRVSEPSGRALRMNNKSGKQRDKYVTLRACSSFLRCLESSIRWDKEGPVSARRSPLLKSVCDIKVRQSGQGVFMGRLLAMVRRHGSQKEWPQGRQTYGQTYMSRHTAQVRPSLPSLSSSLSCNKSSAFKPKWEQKHRWVQLSVPTDPWVLPSHLLQLTVQPSLLLPLLPPKTLQTVFLSLAQLVWGQRVHSSFSLSPSEQHS